MKRNDFDLDTMYHWAMAGTVVALVISVLGFIIAIANLIRAIP